MRSLVVVLVLCLVMIGVNIASFSRSNQKSDSRYAAAYENWTRAIKANPSLGESFWLRTDIGPAELRSAVNEVLSLGPNMTPFIVEQLRHEKDPLQIYRLVLLLNLVSGVNLYFDSGAASFYEAAPQFRDRLLADWDSGKYLNATEFLRNTWASGTQTPDKIDPKRLAQLRRYGVFALPFIIENLEKQNSPELFAAFLIITGKSDLYADYLEHPSSRFTSREEKLSLLRSWASENGSKVDKLSGLNEKLKAFATRHQ